MRGVDDCCESESRRHHVFVSVERSVQITRRHLQISLGVLWLVDGILQCQPFMFGRGFAQQIVAPTVAGLPGVLAEPVHLAVRIALAQPILANSAFATVQILLGLGLLTRRFTRVALGASIVWALAVWVAGEGLGGLTTGATLLAGAPGAAVLYAVIAALAWPGRSPQVDDRPSTAALPAWCALWLLGSGLQAVDGNNSAGSFTMMLRAAQSAAPGWVVGIDRHLARLHLPAWTAAGVIAACALVAIWSLVPGWTRQLSLVLGMSIALVGWLLFQGLGDLTSGHATDPNTGPLVVLLALAVIGAYSRDVDQQPVDESAARLSFGPPTLVRTNA